MSDPALRVSHLSKRYRIGEYSANTMLREADRERGCATAAA